MRPLRRRVSCLSLLNSAELVGRIEPTRTAPLAEVEVADYARRAALYAVPLGYNPPYGLRH